MAAVVEDVSLPLPALLLALPVLTGAGVATLGTAAPTVGLADVPVPTVEQPETPDGPCRLLPQAQQPSREPAGGRVGGDAQRIVVFVPATTCNTPER